MRTHIIGCEHIIYPQTSLRYEPLHKRGNLDFLCVVHYYSLSHTLKWQHQENRQKNMINQSRS